MSLRTAIFAGVAVASIGTAAFAQAGYDNRYGNGPRESTPAEMQQTDQLNQQSSDVAQSDNAMQAQVQSQYQDQQRQYGDEMQRYQAQQERYRYDRARYSAYLAGYARAQYDWSYPVPVFYP